jgi:hypothetical protein
LSQLSWQEVAAIEPGLQSVSQAFVAAEIEAIEAQGQ